MAADATLAIMPDKPYLMSMPHEILLLILSFYFSDTVIAVRELERLTRRSAATAKKQSFPVSMAALLVNKVLFRLGLPCLYENSTIWTGRIFVTEGPLGMSWAYQQTPWRNFKHIAGPRSFSINLERASRRGMLPVQHLREINLHYKIGIVYSIGDHLRPICDDAQFIKLCQANNILLRTYLIVRLLSREVDVMPYRGLVAELKVVRTDSSIDLYEAKIHKQGAYWNWQEDLEQAWGLKLPRASLYQSYPPLFRADWIEWRS